MAGVEANVNDVHMLWRVSRRSKPFGGGAAAVEGQNGSGGALPGLNGNRTRSEAGEEVTWNRQGRVKWMSEIGEGRKEGNFADVVPTDHLGDARVMNMRS